jgi:hypothetical protein
MFPHTSASLVIIELLDFCSLQKSPEIRPKIAYSIKLQYQISPRSRSRACHSACGFEGQAGCQSRERSPHARLVVSNLQPAPRHIPRSRVWSQIRHHQGNLRTNGRHQVTCVLAVMQALAPISALFLFRAKRSFWPNRIFRIESRPFVFFRTVAQKKMRREYVNFED